MKFFFLLLFCLSVHAEERLEFKQIITEIPATSKGALSESFSKDALPYWGVILATTGVFYIYDEEILKEMQKKGRDWRIGNEDNTKTYAKIFGHDLFRFPSDTGSFLYFLGDGWMHASIGGGFLAAGALSGNNYHYNTGIMIWHGMVTSTIFNQALKRSFGRESPEVKTHPRGSWHLFPSFNEYNSKTASYDAMPTGHVMTATLTFTILSERYPEQRKYIYPLGGVWISALMFQMVNNGVHWASDYPLGIGMGYIFGKYAARMGKKSDGKVDETAWTVLPTMNGITASRTF